MRIGIAIITNDFINDPRGLGWHLDRVAFDEALRLAALDAGAVWEKNRVKDVTATQHGWQISLKTQDIHCHWFIDATGRSASLARSQGAIRQRDIPLFATYRWVVSATHDNETRTLIEAVPHGWWYSARLPNRTRVVIFHTDSPVATHIRQQPDSWYMYLEETQYVRDCLRGAVFTDLPHCVEAGGSCLNIFAGSQWIATGDAALAFDPISAQGIFNALYTGMKAGEAVHKALNNDLGALAAYVDRLTAIRAAYHRHHCFVYCSENRWPDQAFWALR